MPLFHKYHHEHQKTGSGSRNAFWLLRRLVRGFVNDTVSVCAWHRLFRVVTSHSTANAGRKFIARPDSWLHLQSTSRTRLVRAFPAPLINALRIYVILLNSISELYHDVEREIMTESNEVIAYSDLLHTTTTVEYVTTNPDGNTARLERRNDEALGVRVSVARITPSLLDLERAVTEGLPGAHDGDAARAAGSCRPDTEGRTAVHWPAVLCRSSRANLASHCAANSHCLPKWSWVEGCHGRSPGALMAKHAPPPPFFSLFRNHHQSSFCALLGLFLDGRLNFPFDTTLVAKKLLGHASRGVLPCRAPIARRPLVRLPATSEGAVVIVCSLQQLRRCKLHREEALGKESAMAFVWGPCQHSPGVISKNHGKPHHDDRTGNRTRVLPNASPASYHCATSLGVSVIKEARCKTARMKGYGERELPEKTRRLAESSDTIPTCENPGVARPGFEPGSPWWEASSLTTQLP
ncbi:hypothetical protein PR048_001223 [Dryococelus australis]|uniref:Uncharacterized protein n=1 Tax=Dryococelus australis TaxID=614101 RepID=A0ABQ9IJ63_9NEOP|nr:hypothetical protein PR048_001223 [Dryococelus australis]